MREKIAERTQRAISEKVFPGCVIGIVRDGHTQIFPFGKLTYDSDSPDVNDNTIYDVASITKSIPTSSLAALLMSEGKLNLNDKVNKYLPQLQNHFDATIEDLLLYKVRGLQMSRLADQRAEAIKTSIFTSGFNGPPGRYFYTNLPAFLLGLIIEQVKCEKLDKLARVSLFKPLQMTRTSFCRAVNKDECAPTEVVLDRIVQGIVHDESARVFAKDSVAVGHAGLFSNAPDLLNFLESLLTGKLPEITAAAEQGLGWQLSEEYFMGERRGNKTFGKTGSTGTSIVIDGERGIGFEILSNRTFPDRHTSNEAINEFRRDIADIIFGSI